MLSSFVIFVNSVNLGWPSFWTLNLWLSSPSVLCVCVSLAVVVMCRFHVGDRKSGIMGRLLRQSLRESSPQLRLRHQRHVVGGHVHVTRVGRHVTRTSFKCIHLGSVRQRHITLYGGPWQDGVISTGARSVHPGLRCCCSTRGSTTRQRHRGRRVRHEVRSERVRVMVDNRTGAVVPKVVSRSDAVDECEGFLGGVFRPQLVGQQTNSEVAFVEHAGRRQVRRRRRIAARRQSVEFHDICAQPLRHRAIYTGAKLI